MSTPDTVIEAVLARHGYDRRTGALRRAGARTCPRCKQPTIVGLNADTAAHLDICDPTPVNARGELAALLTGRYTTELRWTGRRYELDIRAAHHIATTPAGTDPRADVLVEHRCGHPIHHDHIATRRARTTTTPADDNPPY